MKISPLSLSLVLLISAHLSPLARGDDKADAYKFGKEGIEAAKSKQWDKAIDLFQKAAKADPKNANNFTNLGLAYKGAGKMDEAAKAFSSALEAEPENFAAYLNRGIAYTALKNYDKAVQDFDRGLRGGDADSSHSRSLRQHRSHQ